MNDGTDPPTSEDKVEPTISLKQFLETVHPSVQRQISDVWKPGGAAGIVRLNSPDLHLHCPKCDGKRTFRCEDENSLRVARAKGVFAVYTCSDCQDFSKEFAPWIEVKNNGLGIVYKYGEIPPFGVPVPKKVLRLFGSDSRIFLKGRQCENQGLGIGAFAYYRRVVESHKNEIFDEIISVCETLKASPKLIEELGRAKAEVSFTRLRTY